MASSRKRARPAATTTDPKRAAKRPKTTLGLKYAPSEKLDVYVFGSGENGELGLGSVQYNGKKPKDVKRPRLNHLLDAETVGAVHIAAGGMHCVALTEDQNILTWGVNDDGALGRDTTRNSSTQSADAVSDDEDDDEDLNPRETAPGIVLPEFFGRTRKRFAHVAATDSASFALTMKGMVYGCGTFRGNDGIIGFSEELALKKNSKERCQRTPIRIAGLANIKLIAAGGNHMLALDHKGNVFSWGCGEQGQLGRSTSGRNRAKDLTPSQVDLPKRRIRHVSCGSFHSFAIDDAGQVYSWGLNNFGQTGITKGASEKDASIETPVIVPSLARFDITEIQGGNHHSVACTKTGELLVWGRCDDSQLGILLEELSQKDLIFDDRQNPRILMNPATIPGIHATSVAAGIDNCIVVDKLGKVYSWGFSASYRTGLGTLDPVETPTMLENSALVGKRLTSAFCGGQFSVLAGPGSLRP
ncbi:MAG: ornithine carbamoyltransferase [Chaenotheca gracillima]|nr:MAG: ornithine carbamoyltransferase [Chaenotheca gracillima]